VKTAAALRLYSTGKALLIVSEAIEEAERTGGVKRPVLVRVHALNVLDDVLGDGGEGLGGRLHAAMAAIHEAGRGVVVLIREPSPTSISDRIKARLGQPQPGTPPLRDYGIGAQILRDLGVTDMILLSSVERPIIGLEGYGLRVVEQRPLPGWRGGHD
jgi:3,4-dihydroxy 2-butanone 4-phosphate synthase/GTP cyclohydrolase II